MLQVDTKAGVAQVQLLQADPPQAEKEGAENALLDASSATSSATPVGDASGCSGQEDGRQGDSPAISGAIGGAAASAAATLPSTLASTSTSVDGDRAFFLLKVQCVVC